MSQHDFVIDSQSAPAARADINNALQALATTSSGISSPSTTYANMLWYDTANDLLKIRNEANSAWITVGTVDQTNSIFIPNFLASQAEAEAGLVNNKGMTPLRVAQAIASLVTGFASGVNIQTFAASGTYTPTSGYKWGLTFVTGGGSAGGGGTNSGGAKAGGAASGTSIGILNLSTVGTPAVIVGAGGTGSSGGSGGSGSASSISTITSTSGGSMNILGGTAGAAGGTGGGAGGASFWGGGGVGGQNGAGGTGGRAYGSGGGGGDGTSSGTNSGGAGKDGVVMIVEFK